MVSSRNVLVLLSIQAPKGGVPMLMRVPFMTTNARRNNIRGALVTECSQMFNEIDRVYTYQPGQ